MLENEKPVEEGRFLELTVREGQMVVAIAETFGLPERLGLDLTYSVNDRSQAADEVRIMRRELRAHSPIMQGNAPGADGQESNNFGSLDAWKEVKGESGRIGYRMMKPGTTERVRLTEDILSGIMWCLLVGVHPASPSIKTLREQDEVLWPIAKKLGRTKQLRKLVGLSDKAQPRRWKTDDEMDAAEEQEKKDKPERKGVERA